MAGMAVHQGAVLFLANFLQAIQHRHGRYNFEIEVLVLGWIDAAGLKAQYAKCDFFARHMSY
jgi:hypothetical protein